MSKSTKASSSKSNLFTKIPHQPQYRSKSSYANMREVTQKKYERSLSEDERCFLRQVLVSSGMGKGQMLALLG